VNNRLYRHPTDQVIGGVAAGVAAWLNLDPALVRIAWALLAIFTGGIALVVYIVMLFVVPLPPPGWTPAAQRPFGGQGMPPGAAPGTAPGTPPGPSTAWGQAPPGGWQPAPGQSWTPPRVDTGTAGIVAGVVLVLLGVWFLVDQYVDLDIDWALLWPVVLMLGGVALIVAAARRNRTG
jgi:phage shock protein C